MILLGFDYGTQRTGVAVGHTITGTATPLYSIQWHGCKPNWQAIDDLISTWQPYALVVGLPQTTNSQKPAMETPINRFCDTLRQKFGLPVYTCDESYTSTDAYQRLKKMRQTRQHKKIAKGDIDAMAAAIILESWMADTSIVP